MCRRRVDAAAKPTSNPQSLIPNPSPMYLERLLQINMATLAALGALLLGMGQRSVGSPLLVMAAAATSVWLTDVTQRFSLGRWTSNVLMLLGAVYSLHDFFPLGNELQALGFARLLVCLQIILLFQRKNERTYWLLVMLSLLQVVVATLFSQGVMFGVLLAVYMLLGFSAMAILSLHRQWERHRPETEGLGGGGRGAGFVGQSGGGGQSAVGADLFGRLGKMGLYTLGLTLVLFFALPRFGQVAWHSAVVHPQPLVGFSDEVTLGELGRIIESREEVMRVRFFQGSDDVSRPLHGEVYLQGAVMMTYERGQWRVGQPSRGFGTEPLLRPRSLPLGGVVRQKISIEGMDRRELFFVAPYVALKDNPYITVDFARNRLLRTGYLRARQFKYTLGTTAIVSGVQKPLTPCLKNDSILAAKALPSGEGTWGLPDLRALADKWIAESGLPKKDRLGRARYLERKLAASGQFKYSLVGQQRDPELDPIEDFVAKHPRGHCEYFATALTLMLRSQGIPARLVSGFKCDQWDAVGEYYLVRQLHAHAWVEAYLRPSQLPPDLLHGVLYWPWLKNGGWLRLDPTPAGANEVHEDWLSPLRGGADWLESIWSNYVVELDCQRQRDAIYKPIAEAAKQAWRAVADPSRWRAIFNSVSVALYLDHLGREVRWVLLGLLGSLLAATLAGLGWMVWRLVRRLHAAWTGNNAARARRRVQIEFYRRFETLMARRGIVRAPGQTQREFAATAGAELAAIAGEKRLEPLPAVVVEAFYRIRFGRRPLDSSQTQAVEHALAELTTIRR
ncbi:MAG: DUF3488 and transglutaminase-like domain-containing protein [Planctomycetes bacterium]|nr:DUF3488 and transglutaminase-like domain-containing protein [Planctomycetota bacterium]